MQIFALYALLPLLAHAAPLNLGNVLTPPTTTGTGIDIGAGVGAGIVVGNPIPSITGAVAPKVTDIKDTVGSVVNDVKTLVQPVVDTASSVISSLPSKVSEVVDAKGSIIAAVPSVLGVVPEVVSKIIPTGEAPSISLPSVSLPSPSAILGSPSAVLDALSTYIAGLKAPSVVVALVQLGDIINRLQQAVNGQAAALRNRVDLAAIVAYTHAVVKNVSNYLNAIPSSVITNFAVKQLARSIDNLLASYIFGLQVIGLSTAAFAQQIIQLGLDAKGFSPLLPNTSALFP